MDLELRHLRALCAIADAGSAGRAAAILGYLVKPLIGMPLWCRYLLAWRRDGPVGEIAETLFSCAGSSYRHLIAQSPHFQAWAARTCKVAQP